MKRHLLILFIATSLLARGNIAINDFLSFEGFIDTSVPTPRGYIWRTDPDLIGTTTPENPLRIEFNGNGLGDVLIGLNPLPIGINNPAGEAGKESGWTHYSFNVGAVTIGDDGISVFSDAILNPEENYTWEILSSTSPITYDSPPTLNLENWNGVNPDDFSLLTDENSISIQYSAVPEPRISGLYLALLAIGFIQLNRCKNWSNQAR
jgi:hypothetical protein